MSDNSAKFETVGPINSVALTSRLVSEVAEVGPDLPDDVSLVSIEYSLLTARRELGDMTMQNLGLLSLSGSWLEYVKDISGPKANIIQAALWQVSDRLDKLWSLRLVPRQQLHNTLGIDINRVKLLKAFGDNSKGRMFRLPAPQTLEHFINSGQ